MLRLATAHTHAVVESEGEGGKGEGRAEKRTGAKRGDFVEGVHGAGDGRTRLYKQ